MRLITCLLATIALLAAPALAGERTVDSAHEFLKQVGSRGSTLLHFWQSSESENSTSAWGIVHLIEFQNRGRCVTGVTLRCVTAKGMYCFNDKVQLITINWAKASEVRTTAENRGVRVIGGLYWEGLSPALTALGFEFESAELAERTASAMRFLKDACGDKSTGF